VDGESCLTRRAFGNLQPTPQPQAIPPPVRVRTSQQRSLIRRGGGEYESALLEA
jgi:hypothetical protein